MDIFHAQNAPGVIGLAWYIFAISIESNSDDDSKGSMLGLFASLLLLFAAILSW